MLDAGSNQFVEGLVIMSLINDLHDLVIAGRSLAAETGLGSFHELPVRSSTLVSVPASDVRDHVVGISPTVALPQFVRQWLLMH